MNFVIFPMYFLSTALYPLSRLQAWRTLPLHSAGSLPSIMQAICGLVFTKLLPG
jgi:hypothetical protein